VTKGSPLTLTNTMTEIAGNLVSGCLEFGRAESAQYQEGTIAFEWGGVLRLSYPGTWTVDEYHSARSAWESILARTQCFLIIQSLPPQVVPSVLPQLRDVAEHEMRMWQLRGLQKGPLIKERLALLPNQK
jgi:hypothetical protein